MLLIGLDLLLADLFQVRRRRAAVLGPLVGQALLHQFTVGLIGAGGRRVVIEDPANTSNPKSRTNRPGVIIIILSV